MATREVKTAGDYVRAITELQDSVTRFSKRIQNISAQQLLQAAMHIMQEAQELAPVYVGEPYTDKAGGKHGGHLRASAYVKINGQIVAQGESGGWDSEIPVDSIMVAEIGFSAEYAFNQHEHVEYRHKVGESKFLEKAFYRNAPDLLRLLDRAISEEVQRGL